MSTPEEEIEQALDDDNHIRKPRGVEERFETLRMVAGLFVALGLAPWLCVAGVFVGAFNDIPGRPLLVYLVLGFGAVALVTTISGLAIHDLFGVLISLEQHVREIAERGRSEP